MKNIMKYNILPDDWDLLTLHAEAVATKLTKTLPADFNISKKEIQSAVYDEYINIIKSYDPSKNVPITAYCWKYAEVRTYRKLINEYRLIKNQLLLDDVDLEADELSPKDQARVAKAYAESRHTFDRHEYFEKMTIAAEAAIRLDQKTEGYYRFADILDLMKMNVSQREIAEELGCSQMEISKRLAKIRKEIENG